MTTARPSRVVAAGAFPNPVVGWDGATLSPLGPGLQNGDALTVAVDRSGPVDVLYAGGDFFQLGNVPPRRGPLSGWRVGT